MANEISNLACPSCGASVEMKAKTCGFCRQPVIISTFNNVQGMSLSDLNKYANSYSNSLKENPRSPEINGSLGMCYLKLGLYDSAIKAFTKAIENDINNSEIYFYAAISLLNGKKAFLTQRPAIDQIEQYVNAATALEPRGIYFYFLAYIKYDYFFRKKFNTVPSYGDCLETTVEVGISENDKMQLFDILKVSKPEEFP
jgi:tetratricopeptide (TPR) repeat protein